MAEWRVYYADGSVVEGTSRREWESAPPTGVQVVVLMEPGPLRWTCDGEPVRDRQLWTGEDSVDPFHFGPKLGSWMTDAGYLEVWRRACGDDIT